MNLAWFRSRWLVNLKGSQAGIWCQNNILGCTLLRLWMCDFDRNSDLVPATAESLGLGKYNLGPNF